MRKVERKTCTLISILIDFKFSILTLILSSIIWNRLKRSEDGESAKL